MQYHVSNVRDSDCAICLLSLTHDPITDQLDPNNLPVVVAHNVTPQNVNEDWHKIHKYCLDQLVAIANAGHINCPECRRQIDFTPLYPIDNDFPIIHVDEEQNYLLFNDLFQHHPDAFNDIPIIHVDDDALRAFLFASEWRESDDDFLHHLSNTQ